MEREEIPFLFFLEILQLGLWTNCIFSKLLIFILQMLYVYFLLQLPQNSPSLVFHVNHEDLIFENHSMAMMKKYNVHIQD